MDRGNFVDEGLPDLSLKGQGRNMPGREGRRRESHSRLKEWRGGMWYIQKAADMAGGTTGA